MKAATPCGGGEEAASFTATDRRCGEEAAIAQLYVPQALEKKV